MPHEHRFRYMCISFYFLAVFFLSVFCDRTFFHVPERLVGPRKTFMRLRPSFVCVNICHLIIWQNTHNLLYSYWMKPWLRGHQRMDPNDTRFVFKGRRV